ncbi:MAG: Beta-hydroxyacyl-(acyl-carrier-protein) dehydratase FabA/FabZ [Variovorax sp.]|nr:Beta-hydroxyacyl-(acyl-carrier-protein) dehydratase FabA/FabZ [Variovorax sp.]
MNATGAAKPTAGLALLGARDLDAPLAWHAGQPVSARRFLADVARLAERLPPHGPAVNLCVDHYAFAVGLAAALVRGQASLLPPDARPDTLARLGEAGGMPYALADDAQLATPGLARVLVSPTLAQDDTPSPASRPLPAGTVPGEPPLIDPGLHAVSLLTSGSTGAPQPHAKRWRTLVGDVAAAAERLSALLGRPSLAGLTLVSTVPVQHSYGLESTVLLAMLGGAAFDSGRAFFPADVARALASVPRPRALVTTPFHLKTLLLAGIELPPVELVLSATAPLSPQLAAQAEARLGGVLVEIYGSTESGQVASRCPTRGEVWETFGQLRVRAGQIDGDERFIVEGDYIPEPTPMTDVLELQGERHFRLLGRANDLIHVAGRRSSLAHLNYHLNSIAGVRDGAFWLPDEIRDGVVRPVAFVVAPGVPVADIILALRERLEPVFVPRRVLPVASLPREATGKLSARALREFALAMLADDDARRPVTRHVPADHPAFAGHFPGQPLLPGALLLAEVQEAIHGRPAMSARLGAQPMLAAAKFLSPVRPGGTLSIGLQPDAGDQGVKFEVHCDGVLVATGRWLATGPPSRALS